MISSNSIRGKTQEDQRAKLLKIKCRVVGQFDGISDGECFGGMLG